MSVYKDGGNIVVQHDLEKGIPTVDNNVVNLLGAIIGALISASFVFLYK